MSTTLLLVRAKEFVDEVYEQAGVADAIINGLLDYTQKLEESRDHVMRELNIARLELDSCRRIMRELGHQSELDKLEDV